MHHRVLGSLVLLLSAGCKYDVCFDPKAVESTVGSAKAPIIGGSIDTTNKSTVALLITRTDGKHALCSGTVIATHGTTGWVLTAAHCVTGSVEKVIEATDWTNCTAAGDPSQCDASYVPTSWQAHPNYDPNLLTDDFGLVTFEGATSATAVTPAVEGPDALVPSQVVEISGYGRTYAGPNDPTKFQTDRNHVTLPIDAVSTAWFRYDASLGKTACFGDSGGPTYAMVGGHRRVVGVASAADANCELVAVYGRVSSVYDSFIKPVIAPALAGDCKQCLQDNLDAAGVCGGERATCQASADCDAISTCVSACAVPDQTCYVGCATPHLAGVAAFNQLTQCVECATCASACGVASCSSTSASTSASSSSSSSGGGSTGSGAGGQGAGGQGAGGQGVGGQGVGGQGVGGAGGQGGGSGAGGPWSGVGGAGGGFGRLGVGGSGGAGGANASTTPSQVCVPLNLKCAIDPTRDEGDAASFGLASAIALAALGRRRNKAR